MEVRHPLLARFLQVHFLLPQPIGGWRRPAYYKTGTDSYFSKAWLQTYVAYEHWWAELNISDSSGTPLRGAPP